MRRRPGLGGRVWPHVGGGQPAPARIVLAVAEGAAGWAVDLLRLFERKVLPAGGKPDVLRGPGRQCVQWEAESEAESGNPNPGTLLCAALPR